MVKTTINLDSEVYAALVSEAVKKYGTTKTLSKLINEKLRSKHSSNSKRAFEEAFGCWPMKETGSEYTRRLRKDFEKRSRRLGL